MAKVTISFSKSNRQPIQCQSGDNLMQVLMHEGIPVASSCNSDGVCAKCRIFIGKGRQNLSKENETELHLLERDKIAAGNRISCQVQVLGDIEIDTPYW